MSRISRTFSPVLLSCISLTVQTPESKLQTQKYVVVARIDPQSVWILWSKCTLPPHRLSVQNDMECELPNQTSSNFTFTYFHIYYLNTLELKVCWLCHLKAKTNCKCVCKCCLAWCSTVKGRIWTLDALGNKY